jgi:acetoin utilization deacetylase AcuC-like enzyme
MQKKDLKIFAPARECRYYAPGHPESPLRLENSYQHLRSLYVPEAFVEPVAAGESDILAVHSRELVEAVKAERDLDPDTPAIEGIHRAALLSAGAAIQVAEAVLKGTPRAFALIRPPGHHATPERGMGFCYFNSIAIAAQAMVSRGLAEKVAVVDIDCHHGNGTEAFFRGKAPFLYVSLHQDPCYPGTGLASVENCLNFPLPPGSEGPEFRDALERGLSAVRKFRPDLLGVSAGFDTYVKDPLTQFGLKIEDYRAIGRDLSEGVDAPQFGFLEGGYHEDLPLLIEQFLAGWTD